MHFSELSYLGDLGIDYTYWVKGNLSSNSLPHFLINSTQNGENHIFAQKSKTGMWGILFSPSSDWILGPFSEFGTHIPIAIFFI